MRKAYLVLEDGSVFEGFGFGAETGCIGELVFNTSVVGYVETLTDAGYYGQILMQTFPLNGNYGIMEEDFQGKCHIKGYVVREWCNTPSNFRCEYDIDTYLKNQGVPGIYGVDTREITRILREKGTMNATITDTLPADLEAVKAYKIENALQAVTCQEITEYPCKQEQYKVVLWDLGYKKYLIEALHKVGCSVTVVPAFTTAEEIKALSPNGVVLAGGAGNPAENAKVIENVKALMGEIPMLGIDMGHLVMALAQGGTVEKMKHGHHGGNQPAREMGSLRTFITAQNHNYVVLSDSVASGKRSFYNANDNSCEGMDYAALKAFSVAFQPEAHKGNRNPAALFTQFADLMGGNK